MGWYAESDCEAECDDDIGSSQVLRFLAHLAFFGGDEESGMDTLVVLALIGLGLPETSSSARRSSRSAMSTTCGTRNFV